MNILDTVVGMLTVCFLAVFFKLATTEPTVISIKQTVVDQSTYQLQQNGITSGRITKNEYDKFINNLFNTQANYDVTIEYKQYKEYPYKDKDGKMSSKRLGTIYTTEEIIKAINQDGKFMMHKGDELRVSVHETRSAGEYKNIYEAYKLSTDGTVKAYAEYGGTVLNEP